MAKNESKALRDKRYRERNYERLRKRERLYKLLNPMKVAECNKRYRETNKEKLSDYQRQYYSLNREKRLAMRKFRLITEKVIPLAKKCEICGKHAKHRHHPDYSDPLLVVHVCRKCHSAIHNNALVDVVNELRAK